MLPETQIINRSNPAAVNQREGIQATGALYHSMTQADAIESVSAWLERRAPEWTASLNRDWPEDFE